MFLGNCCAQRVSTEKDLQYETTRKAKKFRLEKQITSLIDTFTVSPNAVYINAFPELISPARQKGDSVYIFIRFFNDGRVFFSFLYGSYPSREEFKDSTYGKFGYYIVKDGIIKIELYMNKEYGMEYIYAKAAPKGIQFYKSTGRGMWQILKTNKTTDGGFYRKDYVNS